MTPIINVQHRFREGYHVFTSKDVFGLYVASRDARKAYHSVKPALTMLLERNENIRCTVEPSVPFDEFLATIRAGRAVESVDQQPILRDTAYVVRCEAA